MKEKFIWHRKDYPVINSWVLVYYNHQYSAMVFQRDLEELWDKKVEYWCYLEGDR